MAPRGQVCRVADVFAGVSAGALRVPAVAATSTAAAITAFRWKNLIASSSF
ncbi:MAG TPA: hypothetical protein VGO81_07530 [Solirubrobacteraceae bacterium]|jgi:hypothetical protein|nr:hypothetical protein [Solirubrobacteraceae bacterium]